MKSFTLKMIAAFAVLAIPSMLHAQSGGATIANFYSQAPTIYYKNTIYSTGTLSFNSTPPSGSTITGMSWTWGFDQTVPTGIMVQLCNSDVTTRCYDVSSSPHGSTTFFTGEPATTAKFYMTFKVPGTGAQRPILYASSSDQVILNYQY